VRTAFVVPPHEGEFVTWGKDRAQVLATRARTDEKYSFARVLVRGGGSFLEARESAGIYVLRGGVGVASGTSSNALGAGDFVLVPKGAMISLGVVGATPPDLVFVGAPAGEDPIPFEPAAGMASPDGPRIAIRRPGEGLLAALAGDRYRVFAGAGETGGAFAMFEAFVQPGGGPPPHRHSREEEAFYMLEGEITFRTEGKTFSGRPGFFVHLPVGGVHSFRNESDHAARMLVLVAPGGLERMILEAGTPLSSEADPVPRPKESDIARLLDVARRYGVEILEPS